MRKSMIGAALGLALTVGAAGVASAQSTQQPQRQRVGAVEGRRGGGQPGEMGRRRGGPEGALLKGITLSSEQKARLKELRQQDAKQMQGNRDEFRKAMQDARAARQRGDTAVARTKMEALRSQMQRQRDQQLAAVRNVLTPEQQKQFDANRAEMEKRRAEHAKGEGNRHGRGRGQRGDSTARGPRS